MPLVSLQQSPFCVSPNVEVTVRAYIGRPLFRLDAPRCASLKHLRQSKASTAFTCRRWKPCRCIFSENYRGDVTSDLVDGSDSFGQQRAHDGNWQGNGNGNWHGNGSRSNDRAEVDILTASETRERHKYLMIIAYDGTDYAGWQFQTRTNRTIQFEVESALSVLTRQSRQELAVLAAGRTDAGVHAWGQAVQFFTHDPLPDLHRTHSSLNGLLPPSIRVRSLRPVSHNSFHVHRSATHKHYRYSIVNSPVRGLYPLARSSALSFNRCWLGREAMAEAASLFVGEHDFSAFANSCEAKGRGAVRTITRFQLVEVDDGEEEEEEEEEEGEGGRLLDTGWLTNDDRGAQKARRGQRSPCFHFDVEGTGFMYKQVRNMVGLLISIGQHEVPPSIVKEILASQDRAALALISSCAKPEGLCLRKVYYPKVSLQPPKGSSLASLGQF